MSRAPEDVTDTARARDYARAFQDVYRLHELGRSFSGNERNCVFLNIGEGGFANVSSISGFDFPDDARALAITDWDHDGDLDLWSANRTAPQVRFLRNNAEAGRGTVALRLRGTTSNRDAIGARVELLVEKAPGAPPVLLARSVRAGEGFLSQSSKWLHFGLGGSGRVREARVRWPGGEVQQIPAPQRGGRYLIAQGEAPRDWEPRQPRTRPATDDDLEPNRVEPPEPTTPRRVLLIGRPPLPRLEYETFEGTRIDLEATIAGPTLINLWASWCLPCAHELSELSREATRLSEVGLRVVALSVDGLDEAATTGRDEAIAFRDRLQLPFDTGMADETLVSKLQLIHDRLFTLRLAFAVPTSVLVDSQRRLAAIYRGPVDVDRLIEDVLNLDAPAEQRRSLAIPFPGRWLTPPQELRLTSTAQRFLDQGYPEDAIHYLRRSLLLEPANAELRSSLGTLLLQQDRPQDALVAFQKALELAPGDATALFGLGTTLERLGRLEEAVESLRRALRAEPGPAAHNNLGVLLARMGRTAEAEAHFLAALELDPEFGDARHNLDRARARSAPPR